jgi:DNA mismatch repair ATPase MutS
MLKLFYAMYDNEIYNSAMVFSFGLHGYLDNIKGLINNISNKDINYATFSNKTSFKKSFYPVLMNDNSHVKNTCDFDKSMIITGPNASGKTTILKSSLINVILSQQFGCGCYSSATVSPYKFIHCYLNIPDTSGRDSLFQAEARRCKTIIEIINNNKEDSHFCAFDELYSGTNPDDAVASSLAFMKYLLNYNNVTSILTTHYVKVCKKLSKHENIKNYKMKIIEDADGTFKYTYVLESGISRIKGGLKVLSDMNYPTEILNKI